MTVFVALCQNEQSCFYYEGDKLWYCQSANFDKTADNNHIHDSALLSWFGSSSVTVIYEVQTIHTEHPRGVNHSFNYALQLGVTSYITVQIHDNVYPIVMQEKARTFFKQHIELVLTFFETLIQLVLLFTHLHDKLLKIILNLLKV